VKIPDSQLCAVLAGILDGSGRIQMQPKNTRAEAYNVELEIEVHDNHRGDSPDAILQLDLRINHPGLPSLALHIPIPIEGEKAGIGAALEDLRKFAEREHFAQRLPMLVVGGSGNPARRTQEVKLPVKFEIVQIPYRAVSE
jgi:hypothetical protein